MLRKTFFSNEDYDMSHEFFFSPKKGRSRPNKCCPSTLNFLCKFFVTARQFEIGTFSQKYPNNGTSFFFALIIFEIQIKVHLYKLQIGSIVIGG